jgi:two-component system, OmpR family, response regulator ResD
MRSTAEVRNPPQLAWLLGLPVVASPHRAFAAEHRFDAGPPPTRILLVEDDPAIAQMYQMQLVGDGYKVEIVGDAAAAISRIREGAADLVLLDILLPGADGFSVLESVLGQGRTPVVILSNYGEPAMVKRGQELGARDYVVKSRVTPREISVAIPGWLTDRSP